MNYKTITKGQLLDFIANNEVQNIYTADLANQFFMYRFVRDINDQRDGTNEFTLLVIET